MSIQSARDFMARVNKDEAFRSGLSACKTATEQLQYAKGAGFDFTSSEIHSVRNELQDADLDVISGGCCSCDSGGEASDNCSLSTG